MQRCCQPVTSRIDQESPQHFAAIAPVHEVKVAAHIAVRFINRCHFQIFRWAGFLEQCILHPGRQFGIATDFLLAAHLLGYVPHRLHQHAAVTITDQRARTFHLHIRTIAVPHHPALQRQ